MAFIDRPPPPAAAAVGGYGGEPRRVPTPLQAGYPQPQHQSALIGSELGTFVLGDEDDDLAMLQQEVAFLSRHQSDHSQ